VIRLAAFEERGAVEQVAVPPAPPPAPEVAPPAPALPLLALAPPTPVLPLLVLPPPTPAPLLALVLAAPEPLLPELVLPALLLLPEVVLPAPVAVLAVVPELPDVVELLEASVLQTPFEQLSPAEHALPQAPQLRGSALVSAQAPLQSPAGQVLDPLSQPIAPRAQRKRTPSRFTRNLYRSGPLLGKLIQCGALATLGLRLDKPHLITAPAATSGPSATSASFAVSYPSSRPPAL
jgi:hypothetical protein